MSYQRTVQIFRRRYRNLPVPSRSTVNRNVRKHAIHGTNRNLNIGRSGRPRSALSPRNIAAVRRTIQANPQSSCRRNRVPHITSASFNRIIRFDLQLYPYRIQKRFALRPGDAARRLAYCNWIVNTPPRFCTSIIVSDEATFSLNGNVNAWNLRMYCARRNPPRHFTYDRPDNRQSLNVWVGLTGDNNILGPFFIQGNINGAAYLHMINNQVEPELRRRYGIQQRGAVPRMWWIQDGAPAHRARAVTARLQVLFPGRVVALGQPREWPPRSPDLTPLDFFLWGYLKSKVYGTVPGNLGVLQARIQQHITALRRTRLARRTVAEMKIRAERCIALNGEQVEGRAGHV